MNKPTVLAIEFEIALAESIRAELERSGLHADGAATAEAGFSAVARAMPDVIVLDLMLPDMDGLEACRRLRHKAGSTPVSILTIGSDANQQVAVLDLGADDFIAKPLRHRELAARVWALLRRASSRRKAREVLCAGDLVLDNSRRKVTCNGGPIAMTAAEFNLLRFFLMSPGRVHSAGEIAGAVLHEHVGSVKTHISELRWKLGSCGKHIQTVRRVGYRLEF